MKEKPILFSTPMVRAILDGRKTQTRRVINPQPSKNLARDFTSAEVTSAWRNGFIPIKCPYGQPGDRLWVRETHTFGSVRFEFNSDELGIIDVYYRADEEMVQHTVDNSTAESIQDWVERKEIVGDGDSNWRPSIHMPKWAARIWLEITGVRVERVQDISEKDARAEGVTSNICIASFEDTAYREEIGHRYEFANLWASINGKRPGCAWQDNPRVWVIEFKGINKE